MPAFAQTSLARRDVWLVAILAGVLLAPFAGKAVHIDDPLFLWAARQIHADPLDPYGFTVNWYGEAARMAEVTKNPPLVSYYLAMIGPVVRWNETALHLAMLPGAMLLAAGTCLLGQRLTSRPHVAVALAVLTPAFVVSATSLMCDVPMTALWVLAVWFWIRGLDRGRHRDLAAAMALVALATLTKYFAIALIPLLAVYAIARRPRLPAWWLHLALPIAVLIAYHLATTRLYGRSLLLDAFDYAAAPDPGRRRLTFAGLLTGLAFTGACLASSLFVVHRLWPRVVLAISAAAAALLSVGLASAPVRAIVHIPNSASPWLVAPQIALWALSGFLAIALVLRDVFKHRDADSLMLALWAIGTFVFAVFVNWTINARSILPMSVPLALIAARSLAAVPGAPRRDTGLVASLALAGALSVSVAWSDAQLANAARDAAFRVLDTTTAASRVWFQGHWGFQYYMQQWGAKPIDIKTSPMQDRDVIVVPSPNTNQFPVPPEVTRLRGAIDVPTLSWMATVAPAKGAGFYGLMPLPFVIGASEPHRVQVFDVVFR